MQQSRNIKSLVERSVLELVLLAYVVPPESWFLCSNVTDAPQLCPEHICVALAASLQKHVQGVHDALAQVAGAARRQQGAQFEGLGDSVLVDVCQHVFTSLAAQDDLGVVVVKVDLWRKNNVFIISFTIIFCESRCLFEHSSILI